MKIESALQAIGIRDSAPASPPRGGPSFEKELRPIRDTDPKIEPQPRPIRDSDPKLEAQPLPLPIGPEGTPVEEIIREALGMSGGSTTSTTASPQMQDLLDQQREIFQDAVERRQLQNPFAR